MIEKLVGATMSLSLDQFNEFRTRYVIIEGVDTAAAIALAEIALSHVGCVLQ